MHYTSSTCRGLIKLNSNPIFDNQRKHRKDTLTFNYKPGDVLSITEQGTCIVHLYSLDAMLDTGVAKCKSAYSDNGLGAQNSCWSWSADMPKADSCQQRMASVIARLDSTCCPKSGCKGFPKTCSRRCAALWLPIWRDCSAVAQYQFASNPVLPQFAAACEQVRFGTKTRCSGAYISKGIVSTYSVCGKAAQAYLMSQSTVVPSCSPKCSHLVEPLFSECHAKLPARFGIFVKKCQNHGRGGGNGH
jgi:hypothetical protein